MYKYYTVGNEEFPFYNDREDPQHCFDCLTEAKEELEFFQRSLPAEEATHVWKIKLIEKVKRLG